MSDENKNEDYLDDLISSLMSETLDSSDYDNSKKQKKDDELSDSSIVDRDINSNMFSERSNVNNSKKASDLWDSNDANLSDNAENSDIIGKLDGMTANGDENGKKKKRKSSDKNSKRNKKDNGDIIKESKKKKVSIFSKILSRKSGSRISDSDEINADEIFEEMGSTSDDMEGFNLKDYGFTGDAESILKDLDELDSIEDIQEKPVKKKTKKNVKKGKNIKRKRSKKKVSRKNFKPKKQKENIREEVIKISPLAVILMLTVMVLFVGGIYFGSKTFSYNSNIKEATNYYIDKDYTKAYDLLAGMNLKDKDKDFYKQVVNIMKVEKHINDFNTFLSVNKYTYALESLVRGIESYDKNIEDAKKLGTYDVLENELNEIDTLLKNYFGISVEEARTVIQIESNSDYSKAINDKAANVNIPTTEGKENK